MEKKEYIEPSMIVRHVGAVVMAALSNYDEVGDEGQFSKENFMSDETGTGSSLEIRDVWED